MLETAVKRVEAEGLRLDYSNIALEDLIRVAGVPRSTVFRIWPHRGAFVADLVRALFEADPGFETGFDGETLQLLQAAIAQGEATDPATRGDRGAALRTVVRLTVAHNVVAVENSVAYRAYKTMSVALASGDAVPGGQEIRALLSEIENRYCDRMAELYRTLNGAIGARMRPGLDERDLAVAIMATIDGMTDHRRITPEMIDAPRTVTMGPEGPEEWHVAALAVYGIYSTFIELDD
jgi:AcrR family transcriptional regulator